MTDWIQHREMKLKTGATLEDYRDFVERGRCYVDKTRFIREFLRATNQVVMYTRPQRLGKTLMLSIRLSNKSMLGTTRRNCSPKVLKKLSASRYRFLPNVA